MEQAVNKRFVIIGCKDTDKEAIARPTITYGQDAWRRLKKNPIAMISLGVLVLMALVALLGPLLCGQDFAAMEPTLKNLPPSAQHWFGTDMLGRDLFARVCVGARISLLIALVCTLVQVVVGCAYGGIMAYFGGWVDNIMMRVIEVLMSLPYLLVVIIVMLVLGNSVPSLLVALCVTSWCNTARAMRGVILQLKSSEYVMAAQALGAPARRVIMKHLLPNTIGILILNIATSIPNYIFQESTLGFLGIGLQPPDTSLGVLISLGQAAMEFYPLQLIFPAGALVLIVLAFNLLGDGLRDALDPKLRK
ncbi:MAG: ABC transporter permease [Oscillospiraceae bacterium]|nr:ABC transporter permease [Oscillospiraceae bacterium]